MQDEQTTNEGAEAAQDAAAPATTRREFLQESAAAGAAALAMPMIAGASDKAGTQTPVIGSGDYRYRCHHDWGRLPQGFRWTETHGVTIDPDGFVYIKHRGSGEPADTILVFDPDGRFVRSFGKEYHQGGHGIDLRVEDGTPYLYLCDIHNRQVVKTDLRGEHVWEMSYPTEPGVYKNLQQYRPTNVAFAPDGGFYVGDGYGSHYVHRYDAAGKWLQTFGGAGTEIGKFKTPHGLWLDDRTEGTPRLVVADRANFRLQYFTLDGKPDGVVSDVLFPAHFDIQGNVLLVPDLHARVTLLDGQNQPIVHLGDDAEWIAEVKKLKVRGDRKQWVPGKFVHPHDACFDADGNIYVVEWVTTGRVTKLERVS